MQYGFGGGALYATRTDITGGAPLRFGALQDVSIEFSGDLKELYGQGQFPLALARGKSKIQGKAKTAQLSGGLYNALFFGQTLSAVQVLVASSEAMSVPASTPFTSTVANSSGFQTDLGVVYAATGAALTRVTSAPTVGQYTVSSAGTYGFASADEGAGVLVTYTYATSTGAKISMTNPLMGIAPTFQAVFNQQFGGNQLTLQLNACVASKLSMPTKLDDWTIPELDFMAQADASGNVGFLSLGS